MTAVLMLALFLFSVQTMQITFSQLADEGAASSWEEVGSSLQEKADEMGIQLSEEDAKVISNISNSSDHEVSLSEKLYVKAFEDPRSLGFCYAVLFLLIALFLVPDMLPWKTDDRRARNEILVNALLYLGCGLLFLIVGYTELSAIVMNVLYSLIVIGETVLQLKKKNTPFRLVMRILLILLLLANLIFLYPFPLVVLVLIALRALGQILILSFSQIRLDVLRKIIRKTYATEILLGMVLLIIAFSILLAVLDPGIRTFENALWFCFATVTTIGYGDVVAASPISRVLSVILGVYGIIVVALITSIIVNFYNEMKTVKEPKRRKKAEDADPDALPPPAEA